MQFLPFLWVFLAFLGAGFVQTTTGFGAGIFVMAFLPLFLSVPAASTLSTIVSFALSTALAVRYRASIRWKEIWIPAMANIFFAAICIRLSAQFSEVPALRICLGFMLIAAAVWMYLFFDRVHIKATPVSALVCGSLSGAATGFFSMGGPPMVVYFLGIFRKDPILYVATFQAFTVITNLISVGLRAASGILTADLVPFMPFGIAGVLIGMMAGGKILTKLPAQGMKKGICIFLVLAGVSTVIFTILR